MANTRRNPGLKQQIDENLRRIYREAAEEPVPDRFTQLLEQLRQQDQNSNKDGDDK